MKRTALLACLLIAAMPALQAQPEPGRLQTREEKSREAASQMALSKLAADLTRQCPMEQQRGVRQDSLVYDSSSRTLSFHFTMSPEALPERNFYELKYNPPIMKEHIGNAFVNADKATQQILMAVKQAGGSLRYVFHRDTMSASATLSPNEVAALAKDIASGGGNSHVKRLQQAVDDLNRNLPRQMSEGLRMDSAGLDSAWMTYYCTADGTRYNLDMMASSGRQSMLSSLRGSDSDNSVALMQRLSAARRGFRMLYRDSHSTHVARYTLSPKEIDKLLKELK